MRANVIEKVLVNLVKATEGSEDKVVQNWRTKALIVLDRDSNSASVVREVMNG